MFGVDFRYFSNGLGQNQILFECFGARITLFLNVVFTSTILFEKYSYQFNIFRMFWAEIRYFSSVSGRNSIRVEYLSQHTFQIVWFQIRYFWTFFFTITIFFEHFAYVVNTSQMFWAEIKYFLNLLVQKSHYFRMFCVT